MEKLGQFVYGSAIIDLVDNRGQFEVRVYDPTRNRDEVMKFGDDRTKATEEFGEEIRRAIAA